MIICLNTDLVEDTSKVVRGDISRKLSFESDAHHQLNLPYKAKVNILRDVEIPEGASYQCGLLGLLSRAYSRHIPVALAPHDVWFFLMTEIAKVIAANVEASRPLFTTQTEGKTRIEVQVPDPTDLTAALPQFEAELRRLVPVDLDVFVPEFSTSTPASRLATVAAFMDGVQHYYQYAMFMCGIPKIKILGTIEDWTLVRDRFGEIYRMFISVGVNFTDWLGRVAQITNRIIETLAGEDHTDWWRGIFTQENAGSGGQLRIDGWFVDLYWNQKPGMFESFMYSWAVVPFTNLHDADADYRSIHGPLIQRQDADGFIYSEYTDATIVVQPQGQTKDEAIALKYPDIAPSITKVEVKAESRTLKTKWSFEGFVNDSHHDGMTETAPEETVDAEVMIEKGDWQETNGILIPAPAKDETNG